MKSYFTHSGSSYVSSIWSPMMLFLCLLFAYLYVYGDNLFEVTNLAIMAIDAFFVLDYLISRFEVTNTTNVGGKTVWFPRPDYAGFRNE